MPGPLRNPAKPSSRHRADRPTVGACSALVSLPAHGCDLPIPALPPGRVWSRPERALWRELWTSPQATQWDDSYRVAVAVYVSHSTALLSGAGSAWIAQEFRHLGDKLGLTPAGLSALGWRIVDERPAPVLPVPGAS